MSRKMKSDVRLGRAIIKDRFGKHQRRRRGNPESMLHTSDLEDGYNWGRLKDLQSVTEQSNLDDFLTTAELAGTEFTAEKMNVTFVNNKITEGLLTKEEKQMVMEAQESNRNLLCIPRRPNWDSSTTADELELREREAFLDWRRTLSQLQDVEGLVLTPYEKNLEFWRQLWRVIERSDVVVQIVDARNPLLFRCDDLEKYVKEVSPEKINMILVNKADFLTQEQREIWQDFFDGVGLPVAFFSAIQEYDSEDSGIEEEKEEESESDSAEESVDRLGQRVVDFEMNVPFVPVAPDAVTASEYSNLAEKEPDTSRGYLRTKLELVELFKTVHKGKRIHEGLTTIGLVGYPNVGKSSTINAILSCKKVSVSATPGKTKHFQTLFVDETLCLCDCPGLVMPTFVSTKADMVVNGILPIDQMRDHVGPVNLVASCIPRHILEQTYGIRIPKPLEGEDQTRQPTSEELLNAYGYMRGFMTQRGLPDNPRASRYILKDYVKGKLLYCHAPPKFDQVNFHIFSEAVIRKPAFLTPLEQKIINSSGMKKGMKKDLIAEENSWEKNTNKPWKRNKNHKKKEKLRKVHYDLML